MPMTAGLLDEHVGHCVANAAAAGDQNKARDMVTEATQAIARIKT
jgi:DNA-binding FrmR family transcriptional regulator